MIKGIPAELEVDIASLISRWGVESIQEAGKEIQCRCPFHNDNTPSMYINKNTGLWHCFVCDDAKGDLIRLVQMLDKCSPTRAVKTILEFATEINISRLKKQLQSKLQAYKPQKVKRFSMSKYLQDGESFDQQAMYYLQYERDIDARVVSEANVGWDKKNKAIVIPVYNEQNQIVFFIRRFTDKKQYRYSKGVNIKDYYYSLGSAGDIAIIVEGAIDALKIETALTQADRTDQDHIEAVALLGNKPSLKQMGKLSRNFSRFLLMLDNDVAGRIGTDTFIKLHRELELDNPLSIIEIPNEKKDPGEMTNSEILRAINQASPAFKKKFKPLS
jgi:DNA primase